MTLRIGVSGHLDALTDLHRILSEAGHLGG